MISVELFSFCKNRFRYDANGNILTQVRRGPAAGLALDSLTYHYASGKNQLTYVDDAVTGSAYSDDIDDQTSGNYEYDEIGNLIGDAQEQIDSIEWTVYGKIKRITRSEGSLKPDLEFEYSPDGHRVAKIVKPKVGTHIWTYTYYVRDAQGNIMATYDRTLEAIFDPEQTDYEDVNAELVSLNGAYAFQGFIEDLHPLASSADFVDSLLLGLLASDTYHKSLFINSILPFYREEIMADNLTNNATAYSYVLSQLGDQEFTETMQAEHGTSTILKKICDYDASFINTCVGYNYNTWLTNFATNDWTNFDQMHYDIRGFHEASLVTAVANLAAYQTDVQTWMAGTGGCLLNATITAYFSSGDISSLLSGYGYSNARTALMSQLSTADVIQALTGQSLSFNIWTYLSNDYPDDIINYFFTNYTTQAYEYLLLSNPQLVGPVQATNYYYSKTSYFNSIKTIYGQYTYDVLVGKFITLSNQFKDRFALNEWHLYGSARLGIQKPKATTINGSEATQPYGTSGGRELVHIEFEGSWSEYEVDYGDTSNTSITTYQMSYDYYSLIRGEKNYELVNHLGNVMVVVSDKKLKTCTGDTVNYYSADVLQATDYCAFHATMYGRTYTASNSSYRFGGSNGQEKDDEVFAGAYSAEYWEYDSRLGRRWNVDPFPRIGISDYNAFGNNPIFNVDPSGNYFFGLFGSTSKQRDAARKFATDNNGTVKNITSKNISVEYTVIQKGDYNPALKMCNPIATPSTMLFDKDGHQMTTSDASPEKQEGDNAPTWEDKLTDLLYDNMYGNDKKMDEIIDVIDEVGKGVQAVGAVVTLAPPVAPIGAGIYEAGATISTGATALKAVSAFADERYFEGIVESITAGVSSAGGALANTLKTTHEKIGGKILIDRSLDKLKESVIEDK